ncbi:MAG TPA: phosphatase PAP2 family protein [Candidatus Limnocylindrales bacterium]|nr:phosphatase PAP2 family protein [Candidatus Limnocylindrales bacterium]
MTELAETLLSLDRQLYLAITTSRNAVTAFLAVTLVIANFYGLVWWLFGLAGARGRGLGRRGLWVLLTVAVGWALGLVAAESLKLVFRRPRPFDAIVSAPEILVPRPDTFSFPSGDAAFAFGAAVALGTVLPRLRIPALLIASGIAVARVAVGVHYPSDALAGSAIGVACGLVAPQVLAGLRRRMPWRIFVVAHTHWDREWYERFAAYRERLVAMVGRLLDLLERDERFRSFTFDGQTIAIEDHLAARPEDRPRIEALVRAERLFVGPWYVLADNLLVSGESIVRNFQEGLRVSGELGRALRVAYVADPFGHPAQLPQILRGFGYTSYVFARGVGDEGEELGSEFQWEAPSGDRVLASHQVAHYSNALPLVGASEEPAGDLRRRVARVLPRILERTAPYASGDALLFMVGDDHTEAYARLPDAIAAIEAAAPRSVARIASLEEFVAALPRPKGVFSGEMVAGKYRPILRGVNSTRAWIKQENAACERLLLERCEPLDAFAGGGARAELRSLWRALLENHPHDSICGCSIDPVHDVDMRERFDRVRRDGEALARRLAAGLAGAGDRPVVWNALPWARDAVVEAGGEPARVRCVPLGVAPVEPLPADVRAAGEGVVENDEIRVEVAEDGTFTVVDRASGSRSGRLNELVDDGDRGDGYTYSYAGPTVSFAGARGRRTTAVRGARAEVVVELDLAIPMSLRDDRLARTPETVACPARISVSLEAGRRRVDVTVTVDNRARDHRLRAMSLTGARSLHHRAGAQFALVERANRLPPKSGWVEPPTETRCVHDVVVSRSGADGEGLAMGVEGLREYAVLGDGATIALTLFRAVGWLSRDDLKERRGHAGPELETPSAQCPGEMTFRYCVVPLASGAPLDPALRAVREFLSPAWVATGDGGARSFLALDAPATVQLSAVRSAGEAEVVVRLANTGPDHAVARLRFARPVAQARAVDLREGDLSLGNTDLDVIRTAPPPDIADGAPVATLAPYEIATYLTRLQPSPGR